MARYALLIEAINIYPFVLDCEDLSTTRGGSILLLRAPERWKDALPPGANLETVTSGASRAVFTFEAETEEDVVRPLREYFEADPRYRHATVRVECVASCGDLLKDEQRLTAKVRMAQLRAPSFSLADLGPGTRSCQEDRVRPAAADSPYSASVQARREYGRGEKQRFLCDVAGLNPSIHEFSRDLGELAGNFKAAGLLEDKMAVFGVDGNSFGKTLEAAATSLDKDREPPQAMFQRFDGMLADFRKRFFRTLIEQAEGPAWMNGEAKRIELLMCGGDELKIVVPAWKGLWLAQEFYRLAADLRFEWPGKDGLESRRLEFAAGLIFAHHKAPIHGLTSLVERLLEESKEDRREGRLSYLVLESFDHVGEDLRAFRLLQTPDADALAGRCLRATRLSGIMADIRTLKKAEFPRRKTYQVLSDFRRSPQEALEKIAMALKGMEAAGCQAYRRLVEGCGGEHAAWYHLAELWDYGTPEGASHA